MDNVMLVEPVPDGVRLIKLFEPPRVIPAVIRQVDLMKNKLILESITERSESEGVDRSHPHSLTQGESDDHETS
jgi:predicted RNA-binding protein